MVNRGVEAAGTMADTSSGAPGVLADGAAATSDAADDSLAASDMLSMLKFGAQCCFGAGGTGGPPTDEQISAIIDRSRTEADSLEGVVGGLQHSAADFDATAPMLNLHQLQARSPRPRGTTSSPLAPHIDCATSSSPLAPHIDCATSSSPLAPHIDCAVPRCGAVLVPSG